MLATMTQTGTGLNAQGQITLALLPCLTAPAAKLATTLPGNPGVVGSGSGNGSGHPCVSFESYQREQQNQRDQQQRWSENRIKLAASITQHPGEKPGLRGGKPA